jgi:hypothetical protein
MSPKGGPDTKTNWSTDCRQQDELQLQFFPELLVYFPAASTRPLSSSQKSRSIEQKGSKNGGGTQIRIVSKI